MRIAHVTDCYLPRMGGIEVQVSELAGRQHAAGHNVDVLTCTGGAPDPGPVRVHRASMLAESRISYLSSARGAAMVTSRGYDLVHVHLSTWSPLAFLAARAGCRAGLPVAATVHSLWGQIGPLWQGTARATGWRRWPLAWSAVSGVAAGPVRAALGGGEVSVLANGVESAQWVIPPRVPDLRRVVIASVMRLVSRKRPRQLLRILAALRATVPEAVGLQAVIIGDGPLRPRLTADLERLDLTGWVTLTGPLNRPAIREIYRHTDLYVAPATLESFGIAALEARTAGLPIVARSGTGIADFVEHGVNGLLGDGDVEVAGLLADLVTDPIRRAEIVAHNRSQPPHATWPRVLAACDTLYERAFGLAGVPAPQAALR